MRGYLWCATNKHIQHLQNFPVGVISTLCKETLALVEHASAEDDNRSRAIASLDVLCLRELDQLEFFFLFF